MKIILSRKGFDSANGGMPSPIFPENIIVSLPIPSSHSPTKISGLNVNGYDIANVIYDLSSKRLTSEQYVHLDPDIDHNILTNRHKNWQGAFGQVGASQKHLSNNYVGKGDLFIYFGWFREVEQHHQVWQFKKNAPDLHVIYGWLLVENVISVYNNTTSILEKYPWLECHPHLYNNINNTIYIGSKTLLPEISENYSGYGIFKSIRDIQILTDMRQGNRSIWKLPACFYPSEEKLALTYHRKKERWTIENNEVVILNSVGRGQEFVLDIGLYPNINRWLLDLFIP